MRLRFPLSTFADADACIDNDNAVPHVEKASANLHCEHDVASKSGWGQGEGGARGGERERGLGFMGIWDV